MAFATVFISAFLYGQSADAVSVNDQVSEPVKISFMPQAVYTAKARKEGVEGSVILKILFLANGEIGEITDVTKKKRAEMIKYGLSARAIEAAKKIKFSRQNVMVFPQI